MTTLHVREGNQITEALTFTMIVCCNCGIPFMAPEMFRKEWKAEKKTFYCPNGHSMVYTKSDADELPVHRTNLWNTHFDWPVLHIAGVVPAAQECVSEGGALPCEGLATRGTASNQLKMIMDLSISDSVNCS